MSAPVWSVPTLMASLAALPSPRASTAGESAVAAAAMLESGEESRFSMGRILLDAVSLHRGASMLLAVWLARGAVLVVAPEGGFVRRIRAAERLAGLDLALDPRLQLVLLLGGSRDLGRQ